MKNFFKRVFSVFLCICIFLTSSIFNVAFALATVGDVVALIQECIGLWETVSPLVESVKKLNAEQKFAEQCTIVAYWRKVLDKYPMSKDEFVTFCTDFYTGDASYIVEKYGADAVSYQEELFDIISRSIFCFEGIQGLADFLYKPSAENYEMDDKGNVSIPSDDLSDFIDQQNNQYTPKNVLGKMSYRTDERFHNCRPDYEYGYNAIDLYCDKFVATGEEQDIYIMFFAVSSDNSYLGQYQFHFMIRPNEVEHWYEDRDEFMCYGNTLTVEYWDMVNGSQETSVSFVACEDFIDPYIVLDLRDGDFVFFDDLSAYSSYECYKHSFHYDLPFVPSGLSQSYCTLYDVSSFPATTLDGLVFNSHYKNDLDSHVSSCEYGAGCDFGYVASSTPISTKYNIDSTKIPSNQIINISGDTIYDYSITNPDSGESTTINNYITNNYTYPVVDKPSEPSGGGDVTVGGNISVGGQVDVNIGVSVPDININVNQGSGAGGNGTGINPDDILDGSSVDLDKYYDDAVSQASGVRSFLKLFFDFLPAELLGLICMLVAVAIVCRIFGR